MAEDMTLSVETQEVAEPVEVTSEETQEVAEPAVEETIENSKTEQDSAFAEQRRARKAAEQRAIEAERKLAELEAEQKARTEAIRKITGEENAEITALAERMGLDPDDVMATLSSETEVALKDIEIQRLNEEINAVKAEKLMQEDLSKIQAIDSNVKSLEELGDTYINYIKAGLSAEDAYYAVKAREIAEKVVPAKAPGRVDAKPVEKDFFTEAEVDAMTEAEQVRHADKILASMKHWK
jgi:hypothetical protein